MSDSAPARYGALFAAALLVAVAGAAAFRLPALELRPMHGDEANQAYKAGILLEEGVYRYDPREHHGPTLYYLSLIPAWLASADTFAEMSESGLRIVPALFGAGLIALLFLVRDALGRWAALWTAALAAVSPALVFYSRYFIQETLLVFFIFLTIAAAWRYVRSGRPGWAVLAGAGLGLSHATKETWLIALASMGAALAATAVWRRLRDGAPVRASALLARLRPWHLVAAGLTALVLSVVLFSSFFTNLAGPLDSVLTYRYYAHEAGGEGSTATHDKPWYYYLVLLGFARYSSSMWWSEGLILALALVGTVYVLARRVPPGEDGPTAARAHFLRFLAFYTLFLTAAYSIIPYKTPWCVINIVQPMTLLGGVGAVVLVRGVRFRPLQALVALAVAAGIWHLGNQAYRANFRYYADFRNPYVYAHPVPAFKRLPRRIEDLAAVHPKGREMVIKVIAPGADYWPLPWYLRAYPNVGYWSQLPDAGGEEEGAGKLDAPVVITSADAGSAVEERLKRSYQTEFYGLRPGVLLQVFIDADLWEAFMETRR